MQKAHSAIVNLSYKGSLRPFTVYEDGTAIAADGTTIKLTKEMMDTIILKTEAITREQAVASQEDTDVNYEDNDVEEIGADEDATYNDTEGEDFCEAWEDDTPIDSDVIDLPVQRGSKKKRSVSPKRKLNGTARIIALTAVYFVVVSGSVFGAKYVLDNYLNEVAVVQLSQNTAKDAELTADRFQQLTMSESNFKKLQASTDGKVILWSDKDNYVGQYAAFDAMKGQYLTERYLRKDRAITNPWITSLGSDTELYTIPFAAENVYSQLLYAGSHVRMRFVVTETDQRGNVISTTIQNDDTAEIQKKASDPAPIPAPEITTSSAPEGWVEDTAEDKALPEIAASGSETEKGSSEAPAEVPATEPIKEPAKEDSAPAEKAVESQPEIISNPDLFSDLVVVDLINGSDESVYNLYLGLARMTLEERTVYLEEKAKLESADAYFSKFRATSFVFALNSKQVSEMAKLEKMENISIKYTVLP